MFRLCGRYAGFGGRVGIIEVSSCINLSLSARDEPETGSICDIVVREQITLQGALHRSISIRELEKLNFHAVTFVFEVDGDAVFN